MDNGGSGPADRSYDWDSVPPEPGESHGLPDWYSRASADAAVNRPLPEPTFQPEPRWWARPVSIKSFWGVFATFVLIGAGLAKVLALLVVTHIDLGAAHAGVATGVLVYGLVLMFSGFAMRWTAWEFGLGQVLRPDLYDDLGLWLLRLGTALSFTGSLAVIVIEYL